LAEDNLRKEREMRLVAEENLHRLLHEGMPALDYTGAPTSPAGSPTKRAGSPAKQPREMLSPRVEEAAFSAQGRAREEKWATIARMNKRKVTEMETQARGDERRILRLERALETERAAKEDLEQGLAGILATGEDLLEMLKRTSTYHGGGDDMKCTYGQARGLLRSPNKSTTEKSTGVMEHVHELYGQVMQETEARLSNMSTALVMEQQRSAQLEESLKHKISDLEKARVLFRQIVRMLPSQSGEKLRKHLESSPSVGASPGGLTVQEAFAAGQANSYDTPAAALTYSPHHRHHENHESEMALSPPKRNNQQDKLPSAGNGGLTAAEAFAIGEANNYNAKPAVAMTFTNDTAELHVTANPFGESLGVSSLPAMERTQHKRDSFLDRISAAMDEIGLEPVPDQQSSIHEHHEDVHSTSAAGEELARNSPTLAEAQAKAKRVMEEEATGQGSSSPYMHEANDAKQASKWDALTHSTDILPRLVPDRDKMKERMRQKFEEKLRDAGVDISQ